MWLLPIVLDSIDLVYAMEELDTNNESELYTELKHTQA